MSLPSPGSVPTLSHQRSVGLVVLLGAFFGWLMLAIQVVGDGRVVQWDDRLAQWLHASAQPAVVRGFELLSAVHTLPPLLVATLLIGALLYRRGERVWSWLPLLSLFGVACLNMALKEWLQRDRPVYSGLAEAMHSFSFPSGHAAHATAFYGTLALLLWQLAGPQRPAWRWLAVIAAVVMAALVMAGRVVLGVHYLSDVVAGLLVGLAWLGLLLVILAPERARPL